VRIRTPLLAAAACALVALAPPAAGARAAATQAAGPQAAAAPPASSGGRIQGRVVDGTAPAHPVPRQRVRLTIVERGASSEQQASADASGRVAFTGLPVGGLRVFVLSTEYRGAEYRSAPVELSAAAPVRDVLLRVYDSSPDRSAVRGTVAFAVVDPAPGAVRVSVVQDLVNTSDRTVLISAVDPLVFPLPARAQNVTTLAGWHDPRIGPPGITDAFPLLPGGTRLAYAYTLDAASAAAIPWMFPYGAGDVEVLLPAGRARLAGTGLAAQAPVSSPRGPYRRWSGGPVSRGGRLVLHIAGLGRPRDLAPAAVAGGLGLVLAAGLAAALGGRGRAGAARPAAPRRAGGGPAAPVEEQTPVPELRRPE
jgi:hypothetical protein